MHVLIVDDVALIRRSIAKSIELCCDSVAIATNGETALQWLENHYVDVCITDIKMPVMDGLALIEQINEKYPWMSTLVISSYDEFEYAKQSIQLHALDYILKPIDNAKLIASLQKARSRIEIERERLAAQLIVNHLPQSRKWIDRWLEHLHAAHETIPLLIVDTLELLESWIGRNYYLLRPVSYLWLKAVTEQLQIPDPPEIASLKEPDLVNLQPISDIRHYFRLCAVQTLEIGSQRLLEALKGSRDSQMTNVVKKIKEYIHQHLKEKINLQNLADHVFMNKTYMCTLFKQETQMTVWNYIVAERMQQARNLLLNESLKIYEIAERIGYEDVDHFTSLFKKHYGLSPLEYKRRLKA
ncbi:response regulator transcription factor [Paenibacillus ferrarius]|uniref:response regulator transcription factor n=1 Tax=Paenibacillus ferrarius TaxID=1469647 RepID=UPI003D283ABD